MFVKKYILIILLLVFSIPFAFSTDLERLRREAVDAYQGNQSDKAQELFYQILAQDPRSVQARFALDSLKRIQTQGNQIQDAVAKYKEVKSVEELKNPNITQPIYQKLFEQYAIQGQLEAKLGELFKAGGLIAANTCLIGVLLNAYGFIEEANYYIEKADQIAENNFKSEQSAFRYRSRYRPLQFKYFESYSVDQIWSPTFLTHSQVLQAEKFLQKKPIIHSNLAIFLNQDSNVPLRSSEAALPAGVRSQAGFGRSYFLNIGVQTEPHEEWSFGGDYFFKLTERRDDLSRFDLWSHVPSAWVSWWDKEKNEVRVRYDYDYSLKNSQNFKPNQEIQGPEIAWAHFWNQHYQIKTRYQFKRNKYYSEDSPKSGYEHRFEVQGLDIKRSKKMRPYLKYLFDRNFAEGRDFQMISHGLELGAEWMVSANILAKLSCLFDYQMFPAALPTRQEQLKSFQFFLMIPLIEDFLKIQLDGGYEDQGSSNGGFTYNRWNIGMGFIGTLVF